MAKAVLLHRSDSIYDDEPERVYDFPKNYLGAMEAAVGDWIVYYEPVKAGPRGYFAVARIQDVVPKPDHPGRFLALVEPGTYLPFDNELPRLEHGRPRESLLTDETGLPLRGGSVQLAVRPLPEEDFARIVDAGLPADLEAIEASTYSASNQIFSEDQKAFSRPVVERLLRRPYRDVAFRRKVRNAYGYRCAISGLGLRNGGGNPEVQAAHIRPVEHGGNDTVRNGIALSATLHWMFDRGLISVDPSDYRVLISHNKVPQDVVSRLIAPDQKLALPSSQQDWPHPSYLAWHRENVFGQMHAP